MVIDTSALIAILAREPSADRLVAVIEAAPTRLVSAGDEQVVLARDAALRFGRGRHAAALNFGDCFSYALSVARGEPLLFTGKDFAKTDVEVCRW